MLFRVGERDNLHQTHVCTSAVQLSPPVLWFFLHLRDPFDETTDRLETKTSAVEIVGEHLDKF